MRTFLGHLTHVLQNVIFIQGKVSVPTAKTYRQYNSFLFSVLEGNEWLASRPDRFTATKEPRYPLHRRRSGPQRRSGLFGEEKLMSLPGFEPRTVHALP
jgi:hypothetical protein